jgi:hypothetical protein
MAKEVGKDEAALEDCRANTIVFCEVVIFKHI